MQTNSFTRKILMPLLTAGACGALLIGLALLTSRAAVAQTFSASIAGTVTDPTGAVVIGARLQLQNMSTNDTRVQTSGQNGDYQFTNLLPGTYRISASATG